jgi:hypothetical protein
MANKKKSILSGKIASYAGFLLLKLIFSTCKFKVYGRENFLRLYEKGEGSVIMLWHNCILPPLYCMKKYGITLLVGTHSDAEILAQVSTHLGYSTIRGSSSRQSQQASIELFRMLKNFGKTIAITPDGPRGPVYKVKIGSLKIIQKANASIIPLGVAASKFREFNSWDKFQLPKLFSKVVLVFGKPFKLDKDKDFDFTELADIVRKSIDNAKEIAQSEVAH